MISGVAICASVAISTIASVLSLSNLMGASVVAVIPPLALVTPLHLGICNHFLTHRVTIEVGNRLGAWSRWCALRIFGSIALVPSVVAVSSA